MAQCVCASLIGDERPDAEAGLPGESSQVLYRKQARRRVAFLLCGPKAAARLRFKCKPDPDRRQPVLRGAACGLFQGHAFPKDPRERLLGRAVRRDDAVALESHCALEALEAVEQAPVLSGSEAPVGI